MDEEAFSSNKYVVTCPVWIIVELKAFSAGKGTADSIALFGGKPSLGVFVPIFLSPQVANDLGKELNLKGYGAWQVDTTEDLGRILTIAGMKNAVVYLEKNQTRFYRVGDLLEELKSHLKN